MKALQNHLIEPVEDHHLVVQRPLKVPEMSAGRPLFQLRKEVDTSIALVENDVDADNSVGSAFNDASTSGYYSSLMENSNENHLGRFNNERILTENDKYVVKRLAPDLSSLPLQGDTLEGNIDTFLGKALVGDVNNLYIWDYHSTQKNVNVSRIPLHEEHAVLNAPPKCLFTRPSAIDDSSQVLLDGSAGSSGGVCIIHRKKSQLIYYEDIDSINNLHLQLSKNKAHTLNLNLKDDEVVTIVANCEPAGIIVATSYGRLLFVTIRDSSGKPHVQLKQQLVRSQRGFLFHSFNTYKEIISVKNGPIVGRGERLIHVVNKGGNLQTWHLSVGVHCFKRVEVNIFDQILDSLQDLYPSAYGTLQILDSHPLFADSASAHLILSSIRNDGETYYILTTILLDEKSNSFTIFSTYRLNTYVLPFNDSNDKPKLYVPSNLETETGPTTTVFISFSDAVVLTQVSSSLDSTYSFRRKWEDIVSFRSDVKLIGSGFNSDSLYLMDNKVGVLEISLIDKGEVVTSENVGFIKSHIDQAVYFSKIYSSPIEFNLPKELTLENEEIEKDLKLSSDEIFFSTGKYIPPMLNTLAQHLKLRVELYENLLHFVSDNFNYKISPFTKLDVLEKFEIMNCCYNLFDTLERSPELADIWNCTLSGSGNGLQMDDLVRNHLDRFPDLFTAFLNEASNRSASSTEKFRVDAAHLLDDCLYNAVLEQGEKVLRYETLSLDTLELNQELPWFVSLELLESINSIFFDFKFSLKSATEEEKKRLIVLVKTLYYCFHQANLWYNEDEYRHATTSYQKIQELFQHNHLSWAQALCEYGLQDFSIQISDFYNDMGSLVETLETLDYNESKYIYEQYFNKFAFEFATPLFHYYVEHGKLKELFTRFPQQHALLLKFLGSSEAYGDVAWIQDILDDRFSQASDTLSQIAVGEVGLKESVSKRQFHLSIAKLSALAEEGEGVNSEKVNRIQEDLDIIDGQNDLFYRVNDLSIRIAPIFSGTELDTVFATLVDKLTAKKSLKLESIIDMYTLLQDAEAPYCALKLLAFEKNTLPHEIKRLLTSTVWRRCILAENGWSDVTDTTQTTLYHVLKRYFEEELYVSECALPSYELINDKTFLNRAYLSELYQDLDANLDNIQAALRKELESVQQLGQGFESRIKSIIGTALEASGNRCAVNYESNTVEFC